MTIVEEFTAIKAELDRIQAQREKDMFKATPMPEVQPNYDVARPYWAVDYDPA